MEVLRRALNLLDDGRNWTQDLRHCKNRMDIWAALLAAHVQVFGGHLEGIASDCNPHGLKFLLEAGGFSKPTDIFFWNDKPTTSWADVVSLFNKAMNLAVGNAALPNEEGYGHGA